MMVSWGSQITPKQGLLWEILGLALTTASLCTSEFKNLKTFHVVKDPLSFLILE